MFEMWLDLPLIEKVKDIAFAAFIVITSWIIVSALIIVCWFAEKVLVSSVVYNIIIVLILEVLYNVY